MSDIDHNVGDGSADSAEHLVSGLIFGVVFLVWHTWSWRDAVSDIE